MFTWLFLAASTAYGCPQALDDVVEATEANYAGTRIKLPDGLSTGYYRHFKTLLAEDARGLDPLECKKLLDRYTGFFADHHLFVLNNHHLVPALPETSRRWTESFLADYFRSNASRLDPLEGFWYDASGRIAILREPGSARRLLGFRPATMTKPAALLATFERAHGRIAVLYEHEEWGWQNTEAALHRDDKLLVFGLSGWGRQSDFLDDKDPLAPVYKDLGDGIHYVSMPSFMPRHAATLNAIIAERGDAFARARGLVLDVRGNAGGNAIYFPLADYFLAEDIQVGGATDILVSESTTGFLERFRKRMGTRGTWLDEPLERIRATENGELIAFREASFDGNESYLDKPEKVVVLQDGGTGSAAEAFLFHAGQSSKVITAGLPSRGNIDYMQVTMFELGEGEFSYRFGYPLYAKRALPEASIDDEGYAPGVRLAPDQDWVAWSKRWLLQATSAK